MPITISVTGETPNDVLGQLYKLLGVQVNAATVPPAPPADATVVDVPANEDKPKRRRRAAAQAEAPEADAPEQPAGEPTPSSLPVTLQDLKEKLMQLAGKDPALPMKVLQKFGADKLSAVPADKIGAAYAEAQAELEAADEQ